MARRGALIMLMLASAAADASDCSSLADTNLPSAFGLQASPVPATADLPAYCRVRGVLRPAIHFELRLPDPDGWSGRLLVAGCGGFCGTVDADREGHSNGINAALRRGYAGITMDAGHFGESIGDAVWAYNDRQAELDYAGRALPAVTRAGQALAEKFYGSAPHHSYFSGCSNGGRLGAIAAQRYPDLFDGIASGCPVLMMSRAAAIFGAWNINSAALTSAQPQLSSARLSLLAAAVMSACDARDGHKDGQIDDPRLCDFDPATIACGDASIEPDCLSAAEVSVIRQWYGGARNQQGKQLFPGLPPGSERFWSLWWLGAPGRPALAPALALGYLRYLGFEQDPGPGYQPAQFDFEQDPVRLEAMARLIDALDPDLSRFEAAGGKLLMYHGWSDALVIPQPTTKYFESVLDRMGGEARVERFFRLFMVPGMGHCWEMPGTGHEDFDPLLVLENWVERGIVPQSIVAARRSSPGAVASTRPLCPYPDVATLKPQQDPALAASWECRQGNSNR